MNVVYSVEITPSGMNENRVAEIDGKSFEEFQEWLKYVDRYFMNRLGVAIDDLPDYDYYDAFEYSLSSKEVFEDYCSTHPEFGFLLDE